MKDTAKLALPQVTLDTADARATEVLEAARKATGGIPNMYAGMANVPALLDSYLYAYQLFRKESTLSPAEQELVFLAISRVNECTYCVAAHSWIADKVSKTPGQAIQAIREDEEVEDPKLRALAQFTRTMVVSRGNPTQSEMDSFLSAGYSAKNILEIVLAIGIKTFSNYSNHLLHTVVDARFERAAWTPKD